MISVSDYRYGFCEENRVELVKNVYVLRNRRAFAFAWGGCGGGGGGEICFSRGTNSTIHLCIAFDDRSVYDIYVSDPMRVLTRNNDNNIRAQITLLDSVFSFPPRY